MVYLNRNGQFPGSMAKTQASPLYAEGTEPLYPEWNEETRQRYGLRSYLRLQIPLDNPDSLRRLPELLRGLATRVEFTVLNPSYSDVEKMVNISAEIKQTNQNISTHTKSGRLRSI